MKNISDFNRKNDSIEEEVDMKYDEKMNTSLGFFDALFGKIITYEVTLKDGTVKKVDVTKKWLDKMEREGNLLQISTWKEVNKQQEKKVRSWLLFLCVNLTIFFPLSALYNILFTFNHASELFSIHENLLYYCIFDMILNIILMIISFNVGLTLWRIKPNAIKKAKRFLLSLLLYNLIIILSYPIGLSGEVNQILLNEIFKQIKGTIIFVIIWYLYLVRSKRVREVYG